MIEANELRIGNLFYFKEESLSMETVGKIVGIKRMYIDAYGVDILAIEGQANFGESDELLLDDLQPIPITPEVLEKCGFVEKRYNLVLIDCYFRQLYTCWDKGLN